MCCKHQTVLGEVKKGEMTPLRGREVHSGNTSHCQHSRKEVWPDLVLAVSGQSPSSTRTADELGQTHQDQQGNVMAGLDQ